MYYEVYLDFYFLESFLTDVALLILVKTVMREKWKAKRIAGTAVLESMWSCIELLLPFRGSFTATFFWIVSVLLLVRGGLGKRTAKEVLYGALLLGISSFCFGGALYVAETFRYIPGIFVKMAVFLILWMLLGWNWKNACRSGLRLQNRRDLELRIFVRCWRDCCKKIGRASCRERVCKQV